MRSIYIIINLFITSIFITDFSAQTVMLTDYLEHSNSKRSGVSRRAEYLIIK
jgi:hypothetical protein